MRELDWIGGLEVCGRLGRSWNFLQADIASSTLSLFKAGAYKGMLSYSCFVMACVSNHTQGQVLQNIITASAYIKPYKALALDENNRAASSSKLT